MKKSLKKYRAAVIGCGRIGMMMEGDEKRPKPATHTGAFFSNTRTELVAVVELDETKHVEAKKRFPGVQTFTDAEEMLQRVKPDIVSIAAFHSAHYPMVMLAAEYKTPVIVCEKPIADTAEEGQEMIDACKKAGSKLIINHIRRFDPFLREWAEKVKAGMVGDIQQATALYAIGLYHMGTHLIDLIRFYLGDVEWVSAWQNRKAHTAVPEDWCVDGILGMKSGARVAIQSINVKDYSTLELRMIGTKGEIFVRDLGRVVEYTPISESQDYGGFHELHVGKREQFRAHDQVFFKGLANHVVDILDGKAEVASTGEDSLRALEILAALKKSGEEDGKKIFV
jgi:predicted dehydrogenase